MPLWPLDSPEAPMVAFAPGMQQLTVHYCNLTKCGVGRLEARRRAAARGERGLRAGRGASCVAAVVFADGVVWCFGRGSGEAVVLCGVEREVLAVEDQSARKVLVPSQRGPYLPILLAGCERLGRSTTPHYLTTTHCTHIQYSSHPRTYTKNCRSE